MWSTWLSGGIRDPSGAAASNAVPAAVGGQWSLERRKDEEPGWVAGGSLPGKLTGAFRLRKPSSQKDCFLLNMLCKIPHLFCLD